MLKKISFFILILLMAACYRNTPDPSFDMSVIIPPDSMVSLLTDIHLVEGIANVSKEKDTVVSKMVKAELNIVLDKHGLDRKAFEENVRYYSYHSDELNKIYEKVITNLGKLESEINAASAGETEKK